MGLNLSRLREPGILMTKERAPQKLTYLIRLLQTDCHKKKQSSTFYITNQNWSIRPSTSLKARAGAGSKKTQLYSSGFYHLMLRSI